MNARSGWRRTIELACIVLAVWMSGCGPRVVPADMVLHNGKIATVDAAKPHAEAIAIRGDVIAAVGTNEEIERYIGESTNDPASGCAAHPTVCIAHAARAGTVSPAS